MPEHVRPDREGEQRAVQIIAVPATRFEVPFGLRMIGGRLDRGVELQATHRLAVRGDEAGEHRATLLDGRDAAIEILLGHLALQEPLAPEPIGRESGRAIVCQYVSTSRGAVELEKKNNKKS